MGTRIRDVDLEGFDEDYFREERSSGRPAFDASLLREPVHRLPTRSAILLGRAASASDAMREMQKQHRGCVLVTEDGSAHSKLVGIFTERDILLRIIDRGRNPATLELAEVMTPDPECLTSNAQIAWVLNIMSVGGLRHVPVVDEHGRPVAVVSVRDVVQFLVEAFPAEILNLPPDFSTTFFRTREGA
ncbi:MAG: CBS domain-containing protein [Myxococcota bacterium]